MKARRQAALAATACWCLPLFAAAQEGAVDKVDPNQGFKFKPVMIEAKGGTGTVLGLDYSFQKSWASASQDQAAARGGDRGSVCGSYKEGPIPAGKLIAESFSWTDCAAQVEAKGTLTADAAKNPNKFIDFSGSYAWSHWDMSRAALRMAAFGGQAKYETDQSFDDKQFVFGMTGWYSYHFGCSPAPSQAPCKPNLSFVSLKAGLARVNPSTDKARKAAIGSATMESYPRVEFEAFAKVLMPSNWKHLSDMELNYRHFQELSPPDVIRQAGLYRHRLGVIRFNLDNDLFLQYSRGSQPFDTKSERVVKIGLTYKVF